MDVQQHLSTWTCISKRKSKATVWVKRHHFPIAFQNSSWLRTEASLAKARLQCCTPQLWRAKALEALSCWSGFKADDCGSEKVFANGSTLRHWELSETGKRGEANMAYIWNKFQLFKNNIIEQVWNDSKPGLRKKNKSKLDLRPTWDL